MTATLLRAVARPLLDNSALLTALVPVFVLLLAFVGYCLYDLSRSQVRYLPKWAWALICLVSIPLGGIVYLVVGRQPR